MYCIRRQPATCPIVDRCSRLRILAVILLLIGGTTAVDRAHAAVSLSGLQIMTRVHSRLQQFPYVYEEQSIILVDSMGQRDTRQARFYTRMEKNGELKIMYVFESPEEVKGVTLLATRKADGKTETEIYLPALGDRFIKSSWAGSSGNFLGTDFSVEDLTAENLKDYAYQRRADQKIDGVDYFVIDVFPAGRASMSGHPLKRHYVRQDNFFITRTDYFDQLGRLQKQMNKYDVRRLGDDMWAANMVLMDNKQLHHQTILKIDRRIFSRYYVPETMFTQKWILAAYPPLAQQQATRTAVETGNQNATQRKAHTSSPAASGKAGPVQP